MRTAYPEARLLGESGGVGAGSAGRARGELGESPGEDKGKRCVSSGRFAPGYTLPLGNSVRSLVVDVVPDGVADLVGGYAEELAEVLVQDGADHAEDDLVELVEFVEDLQGLGHALQLIGA